MNKIEKLIQEMCPEGVPLSKIDDHIDYEQPTKYIVSTTNYSDEYEIPVLTAGKTFLLGYTDENKGIFEASPEIPAIIFDDFTTAFKWVDFRFKVKSSAMKILRPKIGSELDLKFLFHYMGVLNFAASEHARHWISAYSQFQIPTPPLRIQHEIVSILDKFTELEAELEAELVARELQLRHFRERLLNDKNLEVEVTKLADLVSVLSTTNKIPKEKYLDAGQIPIIDQSQKLIAGYSDDLQKGHDDLPCVVFGDHTRAIKYVDFPFVPGADGIKIIVPSDKTKLNVRYLFHAMSSLQIPNLGYSRHWSIAKESLVLVPDMARQFIVIEILDRIEALANDLTIGLPAEIQARRKQYEYYRNKLLTFKKLDAA